MLSMSHLHVPGCYGCETMLICPRHSPSRETAKEYWVVTYTERDGVKDVSEPMPFQAAKYLSDLLQSANPPWVSFYVEECP